MKHSGLLLFDDVINKGFEIGVYKHKEHEVVIGKFFFLYNYKDEELVKITRMGGDHYQIQVKFFKRELKYVRAFFETFKDFGHIDRDKYGVYWTPSNKTNDFRVYLRSDVYMYHFDLRR